MSRARLHRRLDRVASALAPVTAAKETREPAGGSPADDDREVAVELARSFGSLVAHYRELYGLSPDEARARSGSTPDHCVDRALDCEPSQVAWFDLNNIAQRDPERARARWEEVKDAARGEIASGHRAARSLEGYESHCWRRASFLAVRAELSAAWRPRNAAEQHLIDQMAQWQDLVCRWLETMTAYHGLMLSEPTRANKREGAVGLPRLSDVEALERAARMVERFHALYLRTLRALHELRRLPPIVVRAAGQVNIGREQVNLTGSSTR